MWDFSGADGAEAGREQQSELGVGGVDPGVDSPAGGGDVGHPVAGESLPVPPQHQSGAVPRAGGQVHRGQDAPAQLSGLYSAGSQAVWNNIPTLKGRLIWLEQRAVALIRLAVQQLGLKIIADSKIRDRKRKSDALAQLLDILEGLKEQPDIAAAYVIAHPLDEDLPQLESFVGYKQQESRFVALSRALEERKWESGVAAWEALEQMALLKSARRDRLTVEAQSVLSGVEELFPTLSEDFLILAGHQFHWDNEALLDALLSNNLPRLLARARLVAEKTDQGKLAASKSATKTAAAESARLWLLGSDLAARGSDEALSQPTQEGNFSMSYSTPSSQPTVVEEEPLPLPSRQLSPPPPQLAQTSAASGASPLSGGLQRLALGKKHGAGLWSDRDRSEVKSLSGFYSQHTGETPLDWLNPQDEATAAEVDYDDEYDDTYDAVDRGVGDTFTLEDLKAPVKLLSNSKPGDDDDEEEEEELFGVAANRNRDFAPARSTSRPEPSRGRGRGRGAPAAGAGGYTGGTQRLRKEQHNAHNRSNRARSKYARGMF